MENIATEEALGWSGPWVVFCDRRLLTAPISDSALRLWLVLRAHASEARTAHPGTPRLCAALRCSERQVRELLAELDTAGLIRRELVPTRTGVRRVTHLTDDRAWCDKAAQGGGCGTPVPGGAAQVCRGKNHPEEETGLGVGLGFSQTPPPPPPNPTANPNPPHLAAPEPKTYPNPGKSNPRPLAASQPKTAAGAAAAGRAAGKIDPGASCEADRAAEEAQKRGGDPWAAWTAAYDRAMAPPPEPPPRLPATAASGTITLTRTQAAQLQSAPEECPHGRLSWECKPCREATAAALAQVKRALRSGTPVPVSAFQGVSP